MITLPRSMQANGDTLTIYKHRFLPLWKLIAALKRYTVSLEHENQLKH